MKSNQFSIVRPLVLAVTLAFGSAAYAQTAPPAKSPPAPATSTATAERNMARSDAKASDAWERRHRASKIIGTNIRNRAGEKIGDVEDIVLNANGSVAYAVVGTGGFLGMGGRLHAVPWSSLGMKGTEDFYVLDIDKKRLSAAPGFDKDSWPNFTDDKWNSTNRRAFPDGTQKR